MKLSENWLHSWVNYSLTPAELVNQLTMIGLEVEGMNPVAPEFTHVIVGLVLSVQPHPDAEKLKLCQVQINQFVTLNILCGAPNVAVGQKVAVAIHGAELPQNVKVTETLLHGVTSQGMMCSESELGLSERGEGIMILADDAPIGMNLRDYLELDDVSIEINITPNRGDCLSVLGMARDIGVMTRQPLNSINYSSVPATVADMLPVKIYAAAACPRYAGRIIQAINPQVKTPTWMRERLRRSGHRCIHPVVDVTNYVLLELGQPMHAFDLQKLNGEIQVRMAKVGESIALLDGQTVTLDGQTLVIADQQHPQAIAGVMGGLDSAVIDTTHDIFLESAFFTPNLLAGCGRRYGLQTDSSYRFERGVDFQLQTRAIERATQLLLEIVGGQAGPVIEVVSAKDLPQLKPIILRHSRITRILGKCLEHDEITEILQRLGMQLTIDDDRWQVIPPSFRFDISQEIDLIEELARIHGYDNIASPPPRAVLSMTSQPDVTLESLQSVLIQRDYQEAITYSFVQPQFQAKLIPHVEALALANPITSDMSVMRTTLWAGLLQAARYNQKRQQARVRLFETGLRFLPTSQGLQQEAMLAGVVTGTRLPEQWNERLQPIDFYDIKADVEALLQTTHLNYHVQPDFHPALHPGQTAAIYQGEDFLGMMGALHPRLLAELDILAPAYLFELHLSPLLQDKMIQFVEISKYPSVRRDIAVVVDKTWAVDKILSQIQHVASNLLIELKLFDVYQGAGIASDKKSLAIALIFQALDRNLIDSEVDVQIERIVHLLEQDFGASLRK